MLTPTTDTSVEIPRCNISVRLLDIERRAFERLKRNETSYLQTADPKKKAYYAKVLCETWTCLCSFWEAADSVNEALGADRDPPKPPSMDLQERLSAVWLGND